MAWRRSGNWRYYFCCICCAMKGSARGQYTNLDVLLQQAWAINCRISGASEGGAWHAYTSIFSSVVEYSVRFIARAMPWHLVHINVSVFLVMFWASCHPRWFLCFYGLFLGQGAHAIYFNESGSTDMAQSYHIHEVESMLFQPNAPSEMSQGNGRPGHEPQQRENSKKSRIN